MCTMIAVSTDITGTGKGSAGWFPLTRATIGYDHTIRGPNEHALLLDFVNYGMGTDARTRPQVWQGVGGAIASGDRAGGGKRRIAMGPAFISSVTASFKGVLLQVNSYDLMELFPTS